MRVATLAQVTATLAVAAALAMMSYNVYHRPGMRYVHRMAIYALALGAAAAALSSVYVAVMSRKDPEWEERHRRAMYANTAAAIALLAGLFIVIVQQVRWELQEGQ